MWQFIFIFVDKVEKFSVGVYLNSELNTRSKPLSLYIGWYVICIVLKQSLCSVLLFFHYVKKYLAQNWNFKFLGLSFRIEPQIYFNHIQSNFPAANIFKAFIDKMFTRLPKRVVASFSKSEEESKQS